MEWIQDNTDFRYIATPTNVDYPIEDNEVHSTYDQFIQLRDTLIFSGKYYNDKAWAKLIVWASKETIEVIWKNRFKLTFEPWYSSDAENLIQKEFEWPYVTWLWADAQYASLYSTYWPLACIINQDGRYRLTHKEEINPVAWSDIVVCYFDQYRKNSQWIYELLIKWWIAVSRWQWAFSKTFSWTTSWTNPNGSCSVNVNFKLWDIMQKMPTWGYVEKDLKKDDILVLRMRDSLPDATTWEPTGNELTLQPYSNTLSVEYIDLPLGNWN